MRFRSHLFFTLVAITALIITLQPKKSNTEVQTAVSKKIKINEGELSCTLQGLYRSQGKILGVFRINNESDKILYLRPHNRPIIDLGFNFTNACLSTKNERYKVIKTLSCLRLSPNIFLGPARDSMLGLQSSLIFNLWFEAPPSTITVIDIVLPGMDTFENIPIQVPDVRLRVSTVEHNIDCILEKVEKFHDSLNLTIALMETEGSIGYWGPNKQSNSWFISLGDEAVLFDPSSSEIVSGPNKYPDDILEGFIGKDWRNNIRSRPLTPFSCFPPIKENIYHIDLTGKKVVKFLIEFPKIESEEKTFTLFIPNCEPFINIPLPR